MLKFFTNEIIHATIVAI